jgi:hypothetical protein
MEKAPDNKKINDKEGWIGFRSGQQGKKSASEGGWLGSDGVEECGQWGGLRRRLLVSSGEGYSGKG